MGVHRPRARGSLIGGPREHPRGPLLAVTLAVALACRRDPPEDGSAGGAASGGQSGAGAGLAGGLTGGETMGGGGGGLPGSGGTAGSLMAGQSSSGASTEGGATTNGGQPGASGIGQAGPAGSRGAGRGGEAGSLPSAGSGGDSPGGVPGEGGSAGPAGDAGSGGVPDLPGYDDLIVRSSLMSEYKGLTIRGAFYLFSGSPASDVRSATISSGSFELQWPQAFDRGGTFSVFAILFVDRGGDGACTSDEDPAWQAAASNDFVEGVPLIIDFDPETEGASSGPITCGQFDTLIGENGDGNP